MFYRGPTDTRGRNLFNGGLPYGSSWAGQILPGEDHVAGDGAALHPAWSQGTGTRTT